MSKKLTIALAGNPNSGKSTVFNNLTGARQHVGNYPGVTVEKKVGNLRYKDYEIDVVDLPGTYSLTAYSIDEVVARNFLVEEKPDVVIDIIDASNLERNLYLATQFMELGAPLVFALNMSDLAKRQGLVIDKKRLEELLGIPLVFTVASKKEGMDKLLDEVVKLAEHKTELPKTTVKYGPEIEEELAKIEQILLKDKDLMKKYSSRWLAVKLLEDDSEVLKRVGESPYSGEILKTLKESILHLKAIFGDTPEAIIADRRYGFISGACSEAVSRTYEVRHSLSDKIDQVLINRVLGLPIFLFLMWLMFKFTFGASEPLMGWVEASQEWLGNLLGSLLPEASAAQSLVVDGIIAGVGSVLVFVPIIFLLFLAMAVLEDSGYMARAAFIMDRLMHKIGLHGRSFIPMLLGFGCNLPAIMATRTIEDRKDRLVTILVNPFMSCGARLPVYALLIGAFFQERASGNVLFSIYMLGIVLAIVMAKVFRKYLLKGEAAPF
ncbi:MAG: ferrous iron transport protein B, partial [bacterium]